LKVWKTIEKKNETIFAFSVTFPLTVNFTSIVTFLL